MKILIIENYDSFTYNLVHLVQSITSQEAEVKRNDEFEIDEVEKYDKILLSPGPGIPDEAGKLKELIKKYASAKSIFGVCLGLQAIAEVFGGILINIEEVYHGIATEIKIVEKNSLFKNIPERFLGGRYHSWIVAKDGLPECFDITAEDLHGNIMALSHKTYDVHGVQFHPESVLTEYGAQIIGNWLFKDNPNKLNLPSNSSEEYEIKNLKSNLLFC